MAGSWRGKVLASLRVAFPIAALVAFAILALTSWHGDLIAATPAERRVLLGPAPAAASSEIEAPQPTATATLAAGETLSGLLTELGIDRGEVASIASAASAHLDPRRLSPGLRAAVFRQGGAPANRVEFALAGRGDLRLDRRGETWVPTWRAYDRETRLRVVRGTVEGAFESAVERAGAEASLAYAIAEVLQWDIDFTRDLHVGDRFAALYEEIYLEGEYAGLGRIRAVSFLQGARHLEAFRYGEDGGFYDAEGRPLEKMFLRSPLPYSRVTSRFSSRRFHPVLKTHRPHYGVDYGAPVGTPVRVTASGTVVSAGWDGGGGKTVKVRHANGYLTGYLHLARFAAGVRSGSRVSQGDIVGYVGATGLATGPHLDYRVQRDGRWIDPQSLASVPAQPLSTLELSDYRLARDTMRESLTTGFVPRLPDSGERIVTARQAPAPAPPAVKPAKR